MNKRFPFVDSRSLRREFELGKYRESELRKELPAQIYWIKPFRKCLWNIEIIRDLFLNHGGDRNAPDHQRLIEEYLNSLPKSA